MSSPKFDTVRNLLQINDNILHYSRNFVPACNPKQSILTLGIVLFSVKKRERMRVPPSEKDYLFLLDWAKTDPARVLVMSLYLELASAFAAISSSCDPVCLVGTH